MTARGQARGRRVPQLTALEVFALVVALLWLGLAIGTLLVSTLLH